MSNVDVNDNDANSTLHFALFFITAVLLLKLWFVIKTIFHDSSFKHSLFTTVYLINFNNKCLLYYEIVKSLCALWFFIPEFFGNIYTEINVLLCYFFLVFGGIISVILGVIRLRKNNNRKIDMFSKKLKKEEKFNNLQNP